MKKCNKCHSINNSDAKYCRLCGAKFIQETRRNILEQYPNIKLVPTNFYNWRKPYIGMIIAIFLYIPIIAYFCVSTYNLFSYFVYTQQDMGIRPTDTWCPKYHVTKTTDLFGFLGNEGYTYEIDGRWYSEFDSYDEKDSTLTYASITVFEPRGVECPKDYSTVKSLDSYKHECKNLFLGGGIAFLFFLLLKFIICGFNRYTKKTKPLRLYADYVQKYSYWGIFRRKKTPKFVLFVKDNMFGILDVAHYEVYLPAQYDYLEWREKKKYLNATLDGRNLIIDIDGNKLK